MDFSTDQDKYNPHIEPYGHPKSGLPSLMLKAAHLAWERFGLTAKHQESLETGPGRSLQRWSKTLLKQQPLGNKEKTCKAAAIGQMAKKP